MRILLFLLTACSGKAGGAEERTLEMRADFLSATKLSMTVDVTADYGERVYEYKISYTGDAATGEIEIKAPEEIAGLRAQVSVSGGIRYRAAC